MPRLHYRKWSPVLLAFFFAFTFVVYYRQSNLLQFVDHVQNAIGLSREVAIYTNGMIKPDGSFYTRTLVMGRVKEEQIDWIDGRALNVNVSIYSMDDSRAKNRVPKNKGREAMAYLTHIIDHYDHLADTTLFMHPHQWAWHNNILLGMNSSLTIQRLSSARVERQGYMNVRCHQDPGCPDWLHIDRPLDEWDQLRKNEERHLTSALWRELHGNAPIPPSLSQPCCAQFAVSRDRIRAQPRSKYEHYRNWLLRTNLTDHLSGRIMEYTWQYIFNGEPEFCPAEHDCYCDGYGICFDGAQGLQAWMDRLKDKEKLNDANYRLKEVVGEDSDEVQAVQRKADAIDEELTRKKQDAYRRGEDPKTRAKEVGRQWKEGDGF